jgi:hypothetical protein
MGISSPQQSQLRCAKLFGGKAKHEQAVVAAQERFAAAQAQHAQAEQNREQQLAAARAQYERECATRLAETQSAQ